MTEIFIPLALFAMIFGIVYVTVTARNKERMKLIEKGADASIFERSKCGNTSNVLKWGMLAVGVGIGIFMGHVAENNMGLDEDVAYPAMVFLFAGLSWIVFYFINKKTENDSEEKE